MNEVVKNLLKATSWPIAVAIICLMIVGVSALVVVDVSALAVSQKTGAPVVEFAAKQWKFALLGFAVFVAMTLVPYHRVGQWAYVLYGLTIVALIAIFATPPIRGAHRWFDLGGVMVQPSEFAKLTFVIMLAWYLRYGDHYRSLRGLIWPFLLTLLPMGLIVLEPDIGTSMLFLPILYFMLFVAGARLRHLLVILLLGLFVVFVPVAMPAEDDFPEKVADGQFTAWRLGAVTVYHVNEEIKESHRPEMPVAYGRVQWGDGQAYDLQPLALRVMMGKSERGQYAERGRRIAAWLRPDDPKLARKEGYQAKQGRLVLGSGGWTGRSDWNDADNFFSVLPDDHCDFIFCVIGGQWGFFGCAILILLYGVIFLFGTEIAVATNEPFGRLLAVGVLSLFFSQVVINVGMTLGLTPVTGMTLPFISYGGSSLIVNCAAMGLLVNVGLHRPVILGPKPFEHNDTNAAPSPERIELQKP
ncbi:MAG: rod shape-determining protein RodA [Phycisphaerae bacterium]|nr:rod shape-determining protein RodA [Phycisphaerae bacterium]